MNKAQLEKQNGQSKRRNGDRFHLREKKNKNLGLIKTDSIHNFLVGLRSNMR